MSRLGRIVLDTTPLRLDRDFRLLWLGQLVSWMGRQMTIIALPYQVYVLTGSTLAVGGISLVQLIPLLVISLGAGAVADAVDRRRLLIWTQIGSMITSGLFTVLATNDAPPLWALYVLAFATSTINAFDFPARSSALPRLVPRVRLPAAIALNQVGFQGAAIIGPAVGGLLIAGVGLPAAYAIDTLTFVFALVTVLAIAPIPPLEAITRPGLTAVIEGLRFARRRRVILGSFVIDLNAMIFGMPTALFPALALDVFHVGADGLGLLLAAPAIGAFVGSLLTGWVSRIRHQGRAVLWAVFLWGLSITLFGLSTFSFALALVFLALAGAADLVSAIFRATIVQVMTPDELRGRVASMHIAVVTSGPRIGDMESATVAAVAGPQFSVVSGGILCMLGVFVVARWFPELRRYDATAPVEPYDPATVDGVPAPVP